MFICSDVQTQSQQFLVVTFFIEHFLLFICEGLREIIPIGKEDFKINMIIWIASIS